LRVLTRPSHLLRLLLQDGRIEGLCRAGAELVEANPIWALDLELTDGVFEELNNVAIPLGGRNGRPIGY